MRICIIVLLFTYMYIAACGTVQYLVSVLARSLAGITCYLYAFVKDNWLAE